jgi:hypothetical protein
MANRKAGVTIEKVTMETLSDEAQAQINRELEEYKRKLVKRQLRIKEIVEELQAKFETLKYMLQKGQNIQFESPEVDYDGFCKDAVNQFIALVEKQGYKCTKSYVDSRDGGWCDVLMFRCHRCKQIYYDNHAICCNHLVNGYDEPRDERQYYEITVTNKPKSLELKVRTESQQARIDLVKKNKRERSK